MNRRSQIHSPVTYNLGALQDICAQALLQTNKIRITSVCLGGSLSISELQS
jgi:hypothetical protein